MKQTNREKQLAILTALVIAGTFVFTGVVKPQLQSARQLRKQHGDLELKALKIQNDLLQKNRVERKYALIKSLLASDSTEAQEMGGFSKELTRLYVKHGLRLKAEKPLPMLREKSYRVLSMQIELQGQINQVLSFIHSLEASENPIGIKRCEIKAREQRDEVNALFNIDKIVADS